MKILIPNTIKVELDLDAEVIEYVVAEPIPAEHADAAVVVVWRNPMRQLRALPDALPRLRLVQALASGTDFLTGIGFAPEVAICGGRGLHDGPVAEHALALTLARVRHLDRLRDAQKRHEWDRGYTAAEIAPETEQSFTLSGARVAIWGFGSIALRLAPMLDALGASVCGIGRRARTAAGYVIEPDEKALDVLRETDVLISLLPSTPQTEGLIARPAFDALGPLGTFVNVGRGATVNEADLVAALSEGSLGSAAIDVTATEPLPTDSPLWDAPNLLITPHVAGNRPQGAAALIQANVAALRDGAALINQVGREP